MVTRTLSVLALLLCLGLVTGNRAVAQDATPGPVTTMCSAEAMSVDDIVAMFFDASGSPIAASPAAEEQTVATDGELPQGTAADDATVQEVDAVVREWIACFDGGQFARAFALMSPQMALQFGPDLSNPDEDTADEVRRSLEDQMAASPVAGEDTGDAAVITGPRDVRVLDDGRVGGIWAYDGDEAFVILIKGGASWLIDGFIDIEDTATPTP